MKKKQVGVNVWALMTGILNNDSNQISFPLEVFIEDAVSFVCFSEWYQVGQNRWQK